MNENLVKKLQALGQSVWLDNLSRNLLNSGQLKKWIDGGQVTVNGEATKGGYRLKKGDFLELTPEDPVPFAPGKSSLYSPSTLALAIRYLGQMADHGNNIV